MRYIALPFLTIGLAVVCVFWFFASIPLVLMTIVADFVGWKDTADTLDNLTIFSRFFNDG